MTQRGEVPLFFISRSVGVGVRHVSQSFRCDKRQWFERQICGTLRTLTFLSAKPRSVGPRCGDPCSVL